MCGAGQSRKPQVKMHLIPQRCIIKEGLQICVGTALTPYYRCLEAMNIKTHKHLKTPRALSRTLSDNFSAAAKSQNISPKVDLKYSMFFRFIAADM